MIPGDPRPRLVRGRGWGVTVDWKREAAAAAVLRECRAALAARGSTVIRELLGGGEEIAEWRHYPDGEIYDAASHVQYFFHRHSGASAVGLSCPDEVGHFHLLLRGEGIPAGARPLLLPEIAVANAPPAHRSAPLKRGQSDEVCHLVAIAVDRRGEPVRLFTTNRWVTGETWYRADDVIGMLDRVRLPEPAAAPLVNRWIEAVVALFRPEIAVLLRNRDRAIVEWRWRWPRGNAFEDSRLETVSSFAIDLDARLAAFDRPASEAAAPPRQERRLPAMAEGWGR